MGLYERLTHREDPEIPVHQFMSACAEAKRGHATKAQIIALWGMDTTAQTELDTLISRMNDLISPLMREEIHDVMMLAEYGIAYTTVAAVKTRLGV